MKLTSGARFGSYEVLEQIGLGGMGEVWRARDSELNRDVAIKVLPSAFLDDADRLARFRREAEILASLNHANIATIHGLAKIDDQTVIVMELVEGQTLADRIQDGPIPPDEAMDIALQIVSGLEAAHERQIVHRDLKPANVKIRRDGTVKLLDFGISKPIDPSAISGSPVMTTPAVTQTGVILGTAAYMSPEQAQGKFVDQRTDIWAFGCLLFEMLTGQPAFDGENVMEILARVIDRDTDLSAVPSTLNPPVRHTLKLCLEKDPRRRIADIRDVRLALEDRLWASADPAAAQAANGSRMLPWTLAAVAVVAAGAAIMSQFLFEADEQPRSVEHLEILHMPEAAIGYDLSLVRDIAMSPDDSNLVYGSFARVGPMFMRPLESDVAEPLLGTEGGSSPVFSPDSRHIAFFEQSEGVLKRMAVPAGAVRTIAPAEGIPTGLSWGPDNQIVFSTDSSGGLMVVSADGDDEPRRLTDIDEGEGELEHRWPSVLRNGRGVLFTAWQGSPEQSPLAVVSLDTKEVKYFQLNGTHPMHAPTEHLLFASSDALYAVPFDAKAFEPAPGSPARVLDGLRIQPTGAAQFDMTDNASLVYVPDESVEVANTRVVRVDRSGVPQPLPLQPGPYRFVSVSPDDERIVVASSNTIWISDRGISRLSELLLPPGFTGGWWARWNLESSRVVFQNHSGTALLSALADGSGGDPDRLVTGLAGPVAMPNDWMADGSLVFTYGASGLARMGVSNGESGDWLPFMDRGRGVANAAIRAPQREWIAYDDQENNEIFLEHVSGAGGRFSVTGVGGGTSPVWANNSNELFYWRPPGTMMAVSIDTSSSVPKIDIPVELFPTDGYVIWQERNWDIDAKDNFYLVEWMDRRQTDNVERRIMRISNWDLELDRLAPLP